MKKRLHLFVLFFSLHKLKSTLFGFAGLNSVTKGFC